MKYYEYRIVKSQYADTATEELNRLAIEGFRVVTSTASSAASSVDYIWWTLEREILRRGYHTL